MIDRYKFGQIVIHGQSYSHDVIVFPDRVEADWRRVKGHELAVADLTAVLALSNAEGLADPPEVLVVGTGCYGLVAVLPETEQALAARGVQLIARPTKAACETYNAMLRAGKRVVAALHLTC